LAAKSPHNWRQLPRVISTHCSVAIAQTGKLPDTLAHRSIHVELKRRALGENVGRLRAGKTPELDELAQNAARFVADNRETIGACEPVIPDAIFNRAADNWEPPLAIAGNLPERARAVALAACGIEDELSRSAMQLADIREVFEECASGRMTSAGLTADLVAMADKPWCECNHGKPLTQTGFARRLTPFEIVPVMIGPNNNPLGFAHPAAVEINARFNAAICCPRGACRTSQSVKT
jgi:putative DNA primase/helicase